MILWTKVAWDEYLYWQQFDRKVMSKINELIKDIYRCPFEGLGKPEPLRFEWTGKWSRRITSEHRLVYEFKDNTIIIYQCRYHY